MKKVCPDCMNVFVGYSADTSCPLAHCESPYVIPVDDLYVDVIWKFMQLLLGFNRVEGGTLEEHDNPFVCFVDRWLEGGAFSLEMFRELAIKVNDGNVIVREIVQKEGYKAMVVESQCCCDGTSPLARLDTQVSFVKYLYRLLDELEGMREQLFKLAV